MILREQGLTEIHERLKADRVILGLKTFKRTPTAPVREQDLPCVFMIEGTDNVIAHSKRSRTGYPCKRVLEVVLELVTTKDIDIKQLYNEVRKSVFKKRGGEVPPVYEPILAQNTFINENRTEGPTGYGLQDVLGMRLVLDLVYTDNGF